LLGLLPHRWNQPENRVLKPSARAVITLWVLVTVPLMALMLLALIAAVPRILGSAGAAVRANALAVADAWGAGAPLDVTSYAFQLVAVVLPIVGCALILGRVGTRSFRGLALWGRGSAAKRVVAALVGASAITGLMWAWWPHPGNYRPIQPGEHGIFATLYEPQSRAAVEAARAAPATGWAGTAATERLSDERPLVATFEKGQALPTRQHPALAMVLVPTEGSTDDTWVFPFDKPLPPAEGDNQALAVNTTDGTVTYDVAFALVWADGNEVLDVNEAHAYASCSDCVTVAVAFQVVLIMDDAQVVVPQNLAVAANYDCYRCITAAIASQLVLSVDEEPGEGQLQALAAVWDELAEFAQSITSYTLTEVIAQLEAVKAEIVTIMDEAPVLTSDSSSTTTTPESPTEGVSEAPAPPESSTPSTGESSTGESSTPSSPTEESSSPPSSDPTETVSEPPPPSPTPSTPEDTSSTTTSPAP
jgi:putative peptide zinc metalloprotease protein